ncbi:MAG: hypothetical protein H7Y17_03820 [Chlorobia bacterium]|nr:hypothetical protein [Fimbriimonadaceae bacterium]
MDTKKLLIIGGLVLVLPCTIIGLFLVWIQRGPVFYTSTQPSTVTYDHGDPYVLQARAERGDRVEFFVGKSGNVGQGNGDWSYGHGVDIHMTGNDRKISETRWLPEGVEVVFLSNHRVFIPKGAFTGGR